MKWTNLKLPSGSKLFLQHNFTYMHKGSTFVIEVDEYSDGACIAHAEHSKDKNLVIESVNGKSVEECLQLSLDRIHSRIG
jgi:hypothetical protein